jgi:hypothetical protein
MSEFNHHRAFMELVRNHPQLRFGKSVPAKLVLSARYSPNERDEVFNLEEATFEDLRLAANAIVDQTISLNLKLYALRELYDYARSATDDESEGLEWALITASELKCEGSLS